MSFWVEFGGEGIKERGILKFPNQNYSLNWFRCRLKENNNLEGIELKVSVIKIDLEDNKTHLENDGFIRCINKFKPTKLEDVDDFVDGLQRIGEMLKITDSVQMLEEFMDSFKLDNDLESNFKKFLIKMKEKFPIRYADIPQYLLHYN